MVVGTSIAAQCISFARRQTVIGGGMSALCMRMSQSCIDKSHNSA